MKPKIYFVSGVCGVGKTSIMPYLQQGLPSEMFDVRDFDERGVPDGADSSWRKSEVKKWLEVGAQSAKHGVSTIICGFTKPKDFVEIVSDDTPEIEVMLLDADPETIRTRLVGRYSKDGVFDESQKVIGKPVNDFIESNVYYCTIMRKEWADEGCTSIDTTTLNPEQVAQEVVKHIQRS